MGVTGRAMRRLAVLIWCALAALAACGTAPTPAPPPPTPADRGAQVAQLTQVAAHLTATAERRAADRSATAAAPTPTPPVTPTVARPATRAPVATSAATANLADFRVTAYQGDASLGGRDTRLSAAFAYGLPVVVNFWAPLCPPCRAELPAFQRVSEEFAGQVFFLGVDLSPYAAWFGGEAEARQLIRETGIRYPVAYVVDNPTEDYRIRTLPLTVFFAADGQIFKTFDAPLTEGTLRRTVRELLAAGGAQP